MTLRKLFAVLAVLALVAAACGDSGSTTVAETQPPATEAPSTEAPTTEAPATEAPTETTEPAMAMPVGDVGFDAETGTIKLGVLAATTGPIADIGQTLLAGHQAYWGAVNAQGGVLGQYPVELVIRDNGYNPETNVTVYNEIKDEVLAFSSTIGTPTTATIFEDAAANDIVVNAGSLASQWALTDNVVLNLGSNTYFAQFANAPYWAMEIADPPVITDASVVGIVYQDDPELIRDFVARRGGWGRTLLDPDGEAAIAYGVYGAPETYFLDAGGTVVRKVTGPMGADFLSGIIEGLL